MVLFAAAAAATVVYANFGLLQLADGGSRAGTLSPSMWLGATPVATAAPIAAETTTTVTVATAATPGTAPALDDAATVAPPAEAASTTSTTLSYFDSPFGGRDHHDGERRGTVPGYPPPTRYDDD